MIATIARSIARRSAGRSAILRFGSTGPDMPPFARLRPPTGKIPEETELVWDDSVAPETCVDFDAPHVPSHDVFKSFLLAMGFFGGIYALIVLSDPVSCNPVAPRSAVISQESFDYSMGKAAVEEESAEDEED